MKTVYTCFCTDVIHAGHLNIINEAKKLGRVIVGCLSDEASIRYNKFPTISQEDRLKLYRSIEGVEEVVIQNDMLYDDVITLIKPDYIVHGDNWADGPEKSIRDHVENLLKEYGGELVDIPYTYNENVKKIDMQLREKLAMPEYRRKRLRQLLKLTPIVKAMEAHSGLTGLIVESGQKKSIRLSRVGIVVKHQLKDDFFGEKNTPLTATMELVNMVNQGIQEGVKNSATFRFMAQLTSKIFDEDLRKERERFDKNNFQTGGGGLLLFGNQFSNISQIKQEGYKVDPEQSKLIKDNVMDYFGVSEAILQNRATGDELDSFFNSCTEIFSIKMSEALTAMVFTQREINGGNAIKFLANRLQYMSVNSKISMAQQLGDRGILTIDEIRELFNYEPLPDGTGQHVPIRGEYYFADEGKQPAEDEQDDQDDNEDGGEDDEE